MDTVRTYIGHSKHYKVSYRVCESGDDEQRKLIDDVVEDIVHRPCRDQTLAMLSLNATGRFRSVEWLEKNSLAVSAEKNRCVHEKSLPQIQDFYQMCAKNALTQTHSDFTGSVI